MGRGSVLSLKEREGERASKECTFRESRKIQSTPNTPEHWIRNLCPEDPDGGPGEGNGEALLLHGAHTGQALMAATPSNFLKGDHRSGYFFNVHSPI